MSEITAHLVKELREKTGAGMMECKKALSEVDGNLEDAIDYLRKKGLSVAQKKAGRVAAQGLVGVHVSDTEGTIVELNSETDFVARNTEFQDFLKTVLETSLTHKGDLESIKNTSLSSGKTVDTTLTELIAKIGENMNLRRAKAISVSNGVVVSYTHTAIAPNLGKIGVLVGLESTGNKETLTELAKKIAMHIAATAPLFLGVKDVDENSLNREKQVLIEQARASGKPEAIIEKMVEGRIRKYYEEVVLLEQIFIMDNEKKISDVIKETEKQIGTSIELKGFVRYALGEGIEKKEEDFAEEVQKQLSK